MVKVVSFRKAASKWTLSLSLALSLFAADVPPAQTISADLLRQPLSRKAKQILQKAQRFADTGDHLRAIRLLEAARSKYPESAAWTQSMLGVEYLKTGRFADAVTSLEQTILLLPHDAVDRSNLGLALALTGEYDRAERELLSALSLDRSDGKTRQLLEIVQRRALQPPSGQ
jgi:Flp pilus assembly protein TadD